MEDNILIAAPKQLAQVQFDDDEHTKKIITHAKKNYD